MTGWRAGLAVAFLMLASACSSDGKPRPVAHTVGVVPRDTRGEPVFATIRALPAVPVPVPMPVPNVETAAVTTIPEVFAPMPPTGATVIIPTDPSQLAPAKRVSCRHLRRCP